MFWLSKTCFCAEWYRLHTSPHVCKSMVFAHPPSPTHIPPFTNDPLQRFDHVQQLSQLYNSLFTHFSQRSMIAYIYTWQAISIDWWFINRTRRAGSQWWVSRILSFWVIWLHASERSHSTWRMRRGFVFKHIFIQVHLDIPEPLYYMVFHTRNQ